MKNRNHPRYPAIWLFAALLGFTSLAIAQTYTYDDLGRLKTVTHNGKTTTYNYDAAGNRASTRTTTDYVNSPPACQDIVIDMSNVPTQSGPVQLSLTASMIMSACPDPDDDPLIITAPSSLPQTVSVAAGQTVQVTFAVTDGNGGSGSAVMRVSRP